MVGCSRKRRWISSESPLPGGSRTPLECAGSELNGGLFQVLACLGRLRFWSACARKLLETCASCATCRMWHVSLVRFSPPMCWQLHMVIHKLLRALVARHASTVGLKSIYPHPRCVGICFLWFRLCSTYLLGVFRGDTHRNCLTQGTRELSESEPLDHMNAGIARMTGGDCTHKPVTWGPIYAQKFLGINSSQTLHAQMPNLYTPNILGKWMSHTFGMHSHWERTGFLYVWAWITSRLCHHQSRPKNQHCNWFINS